MTNDEQSQAFGGVIDVLEAIEARYAIWGGLAVVAYGEPRFTQDMDILLSPERFAVSLFIRRLRIPAKTITQTGPWRSPRPVSAITPEQDNTGHKIIPSVHLC